MDFIEEQMQPKQQRYISLGHQGHLLPTTELRRKAISFARDLGGKLLLKLICIYICYANEFVAQ